VNLALSQKEGARIETSYAKTSTDSIYIDETILICT